MNPSYITQYLLHSKLPDRDVDNSLFLSCVNISHFAESQSATVYLGGRYVSGLEAGILKYCRVHTHTWIHTPNRHHTHSDS